jgi:hypothetical protein
MTASLPLVAPSQTAPASVAIGDTKITLGMLAQQALAALRENYKVENVVETPVHRWVIENKTKPNAIIGFLYANHTVIEGIEHLVLSRNLDSAEDIFGALYDVSSKLSQKTGSPCLVTTQTSYNPVGLSAARVHFNCGPYRFRLVREQYKSDSDNLSATSYEVWEELGATDNQ